MVAWKLFEDPSWTDVIRSHAQTGWTYVQQAFQEAPTEPFINTLGLYALQAAPLVGLGGSLLLGWEAYRDTLAAQSMFNDPSLKGSSLPWLQAGMALSRGAQTLTTSVSSLAQLDILTFSAWEGLARVAEGSFLPVVLVGEGLRGVIAYRQYRLGRISQHDLYRSMAGPLILGGFVAGGAAIGALVGSLPGGVTAAPGAWIGAKIGAVAAIPFQFLGGALVDNWHGSSERQWNEKQRLRINAALEARYGLGGDNSVEH